MPVLDSRPHPGRQGKTSGSEFECALEWPGGLVKPQGAGPTPGVSDSVGLGGARESASVTGSQVTPMLLILGSY